MSGSIVLIGMAGSGKTTIGRMLAERLGRPFVDVDGLIEARFGKIDALFEKGEAHFRQCEAAAVREACTAERAIIATGGGAVTEPDTMDALKQAGKIVFIDRPIDRIAADIDLASRPLYVCGFEALYKTYVKRLPLYRQYADVTVDNAGTVDGACRGIIELIAEGKL